MPDQTAGLLSPWLRKRRLEMARPHIDGRVLDFGCGIGALADSYPPALYLGVDVDSDSLEIARRTHPSHKFVHMSELHETGNFDRIVALAVLEHVKDPFGLVKQWRDLLKPTGRIVMTTPHVKWDWIHEYGAKLGVFSRHASEEHETLFNESDLRVLMRKAGLRVLLYQRFLYGANQLVVAEPSVSVSR